MLIDTHQVVEDIIKSGLKKNQAEIITRAINQSNNNLVTKSDLKASTEKLETKIDSTKSELNTMKWMIGLLFASNLMIIGLLFSLIFNGI